MKSGDASYDRILAFLKSTLTPAIDEPSGSILSSWRHALLVTVVMAAVYAFLVVRIDNTNVGTSNGLWKSVAVSMWKHGPADLDSGGYLYIPAYGRLASLIPESLLRYGTPAPDVTFRQMAILNALFSGIASGLMFLLALSFTGSRTTAAVLTFLHAGVGFVVLNSVNSEDIIPAYAMFLAATLCFFEFLKKGGVVRFVGSALFLALAALFHWTLLIPALASFGAVFGFLSLRRPRFLAVGAIWLVVFLGLAKAAVSVALPDRSISISSVVYPAKADAKGWVGLAPQKVWYLLIGTGNYFSGAENVANYHVAFEQTRILGHMIVSWIVLGMALIVCLYTMVRKSVRPSLRLLALSGVALFLIGELGALYSQPQDPQMQIQPMFIVMESLMILGATVFVNLRPASFVAPLVAVSTLNGAENVRLLSKDRGADSRALAGIVEMDRLFPKDKTVIIAQGYEAWVTWQYALLWPGDFTRFVEKNVMLTIPFSTKRGITANEALAQVGKQIEDGFAQGRSVVASPIWVESVDAIASSLTSVTDDAAARAFTAGLKSKYKTGTRWETLIGPFVEILPPAPSESGRELNDGKVSAPAHSVGH